MDWRIKFLKTHFPVYMSLKDSYFDRHYSDLVDCVNNELYASAYFHLHILYMMFVYTQLFRISREKQRDFRLCTTGYRRRDGSDFTTITSLHDFSDLSEKAVFRLFRMVGFRDDTIGKFAKVIRDRNAYLHASGEIPIEDHTLFYERFDTYLDHMLEILEGQQPFLEKIYSEALSSYEEEGRDLTADNIEDEIEIYFSNDTYNLSPYELRILADGKDDPVSSLICEEYSGLFIYTED